MIMKYVRRVAAPLTAALAASLLVAAPAPASAAGGRYSADIRRTEYGIPHISAKDHGGLGYGYGYAFAQDNLCVMASWVLTLRGERSRHFGAEAMSDDAVDPVSNLASDVYYKSVQASGVLRRVLARPAPHGPGAELRALVDGYVAGFNRYLSDTGVDRLPDPACRGKEWVGPITATDVWTNLLDLGRLGSGSSFKEAIAASGQAGEGGGKEPEKPEKKVPAKTAAPPGSNAFAIGREATRDGHGMLLADPHFPWNGSRRFYQVHLTIPGVLDVSGGSLYGTPVVQIGHNATLAWTHTVSHAQRFTLYRLKLVPGQRTTYLVDGRPEPMGRQEVTVTVRDAGGAINPVTTTLYTSRYGPVLAMDWTEKTAVALADANVANLRFADEWLAMGAARDVAALRRAQDTYQGMPFVYTLATDAGGTAYFADASVVPHVTDEQAKRCHVGDDPEPLILDGSTSACLWGRDADAIEPGVFGPAAQPRLSRADYVTNANAGPWLTNPKAPLTGYPRVYGDTRTERDLRTRVGLDMVARRLSGGDGLGAPGFTLDTLQRTATGKRNLSAELLRADLRALCRAKPVMTASGGEKVDVRRACATLAAWDGRARLGSRGAILWREFFMNLNGPHRRPDGEVVPPESWWKVPFDPEQPLTTPRGLDIANPAVQSSLADAVRFFTANELPLTLTPGQAQRYGGVPVPGCTEGEGCFDRIRTGGPLSEAGRYPDVNTGSSFMMAVELTPAGPRTRTVLTYSLSAGAASPHHADQTELFSRGGWVTERFTEAEIRAYPHLTTTSLR
ncbi:penicillin acylase family protein [Streptosporangium pseudovulgare]|uniref:Penicillin amidase n=1 Tax=Streptosporangium pseudovulgare TaxID=35765 RepID=A0ABQ2R8C5_9ACTN|nr:penicillin acylase family protein [Streptosporangium pseudovulgare]GGQ13643.1 penicillin amidase [Streptosporangium pseudovulgare]